MSEPSKPPPLTAVIEPLTPVSATSRPTEDHRPPWLRLLHPWSAALLLTVDSLCFGANAVTGFLATPVVVVVAFGATFAGVYKVQRNRAEDGKMASLLKAFVCGVLAGLPFPIAGTAVGGVVLLAAGMSAANTKKPPTA